MSLKYEPASVPQDKEHALAVGHTQMSSADIIANNKGALSLL